MCMEFVDRTKSILKVRKIICNISVLYVSHKTSYFMSVSPNVKFLDKILDLLYSIVT